MDLENLGKGWMRSKHIVSDIQYILRVVFFFKFVGILKDKAKRSFQKAYKCEIRKLKIDDKLRRKTITKLGLL